MRILIVGAGIAGLGLAALLKQRGITAEVIEKAERWSDVGYSLDIWRNGYEVLERLGMGERFKRCYYPIRTTSFSDGAGRLVKRFEFPSLKKKYPFIQAEIPRSALHDMLSEAVEGISVDMDVTVARLEQTPDGVGVLYSNGTRKVFDLVVGADGIHSQIRSLCFGDSYERPLGLRSYFAWVDPRPLGIPDGITELCEPGRIVAAFPVAPDRCNVCFIQPPTSERATPESLRQDFAAFSYLAPAVLDSLPAGEALAQADYSEVVVPSWSAGRVVLLGDAAHAVAPLAGMGASLALRGAETLADRVAALGPEEPFSRALAEYERLHRPTVEAVRRQVDQIWRWSTLRSPLLCRLRNAVVPHVPESYFIGGFSKIVGRGRS